MNVVTFKSVGILGEAGGGAARAERATYPTSSSVSTSLCLRVWQTDLSLERFWS